MSHKKRQVKIWCDDDDIALLEYNAKKAGMSKSEYIRNLLYHGNVERHTNYTPDDARMLLGELCDISNSMAQIAYSARIKNSVDEGEYSQLEANFIRLIETTNEHING